MDTAIRKIKQSQASNTATVFLRQRALSIDPENNK